MIDRRERDDALRREDAHYDRLCEMSSRASMSEGLYANRLGTQKTYTPEVKAQGLYSVLEEFREELHILSKMLEVHIQRITPILISVPGGQVDQEKEVRGSNSELYYSLQDLMYLARQSRWRLSETTDNVQL
jgi:uncharacterized protein YdcH (DUF465 family)